MTLQTIKLGGFTAEEIAKINQNFETIEANCAETGDIPSLTDYVTDTEFTTALNGKVDKIPGKDLSTNDYTNNDKSIVGNIGKISFSDTDFSEPDSNGYRTATIAAATKEPVQVLRNNNGTYESVIVDVKKSGTNILIVAAEAFSGYVLTI